MSRPISAMRPPSSGGGGVDDRGRFGSGYIRGHLLGSSSGANARARASRVGDTGRHELRGSAERRAALSSSTKSATRGGSSGSTPSRARTTDFQSG